jgi:hypothetical protein
MKAYGDSEEGDDVKSICGIIIGETSSAEEAKSRAENMKNCPNLVVLGTASNRIYFVYIVPSEKEWWLRYPEKNPKETGLEKATAHIIENVACPEEFAPVLPEKKTDTAPCGANCETCLLREQYSCGGCLATVHYREAAQRTRK